MKRFYKLYIRYDIVSLVEYLGSILFLLPRIRLFNWLKSNYLSLFFNATIGQRVVYYPGVTIFTGRGLKVGNDVDFARGVQVYSDGGIEIGDRVLIGFNTIIISVNHKIPKSTSPIFSAGYENKKIIINEDVWIGCNCTILPGVCIGQGAVVAAGSVVTKNISPYSIVGGVPAKELKSRLVINK